MPTLMALVVLGRLFIDWMCSFYCAWQSRKVIFVIEMTVRQIRTARPNSIGFSSGTDDSIGTETSDRTGVRPSVVSPGRISRLKRKLATFEVSRPSIMLSIIRLMRHPTVKIVSRVFTVMLVVIVVSSVIGTDLATEFMAVVANVVMRNRFLTVMPIILEPLYRMFVSVLNISGAVRVIALDSRPVMGNGHVSLVVV